MTNLLPSRIKLSFLEGTKTLLLP